MSLFQNIILKILREENVYKLNFSLKNDNNDQRIKGE